MTVVVTGIGAVSGFGWGADALWRGLLSGATAIRTPHTFDTSGQRTALAAEVPPDAAVEDPSRRTTLSRADRFAIAAASEAVAAAGARVAGDRAGVFCGGSTAGMRECEEFVARLVAGRAGPPSLSLLAAQQLSAPGDAVARHLGVRGPVIGFSSACASGAMAVGAALEAVRSGEVDVAVAGGADALCLLTYSGFNALRSVDAGPSRPFRHDRAGLSLGEGAGMLVLETAAHAASRGVAPLAEIAGYGASCDAYHMTAPRPEGDGALVAMTAALDDASLTPGDLGVVNAHGTGTELNDDAESCALRRLFGERASAIPVTAPKGAVGHILGAAGAIEAVASVLGIIHDTIFPTAGDDPVDPAFGIDLVVGAPRPAGGRSWISTNLAFGGANAALILRPAEEARP